MREVSQAAPSYSTIHIAGRIAILSGIISAVGIVFFGVGSWLVITGLVARYTQGIYL